MEIVAGWSVNAALASNTAPRTKRVLIKTEAGRHSAIERSVYTSDWRVFLALYDEALEISTTIKT